MNKTKIPKFKDYAEEAKFWDSHDISDYLEEIKLVDLKLQPQPKKEEIIAIRIAPKLKIRLQKLAQEYGVNLSTLSRMWLVERLRKIEETGRFTP